jgi:uncharacterized protein YdiU (UPF0061 family)
LPELFFVRQKPVPVRAPEIVLFNDELAQELGLSPESLSGKEGAAIFVGNTIPAGGDPIAQAYAGHQFGGFAMLGDGRAVLLGEQITPAGDRVDLQLKGSGQTPFSRRGDGRAALGPMLREYLISEAMHALGIPTTRSLAVVTTGEPVFRETPLQGAILTRVAASHIRVGTFQYAAAKGGPAAVKALADYAIARHFPKLDESDHPYLALLKAVMDRQALLVARWMGVGFVHGVMNTDNVSICGETIDYGPCAFMDAYDPATVFSSIDHQGRYAYGRQPQVAEWNMARFAEALLPLLHESEQEALNIAKAALDTFPESFHKAWMNYMRAKLGLFNEEEGDEGLVKDLLTQMHQHQADFTNTFRALSTEPPEFLSEWSVCWRERLQRQPQSLETAHARMDAHNPAIIPRNHRVEEALEAAVDRADVSLFNKLLAVLRSPYEMPPGDYHQPPPPTFGRYKTFCGT